MKKKDLELRLTAATIGFLLSGFGLHLTRTFIDAQTLPPSMTIMLGTVMAGIGAGITSLMIILLMEVLL